jgi:hypothetical protein
LVAAMLAHDALVDGAAILAGAIETPVPMDGLASESLAIDTNVARAQDSRIPQTAVRQQRWRVRTWSRAHVRARTGSRDDDT